MSRRRARPAELHSVFERTFHEHRRALVGWLAGLMGLAVVMLALYPTVKGNEAITKLIESYPETFRKLFAVADYTTGAGYLRAEIFSFMAPLLVVIMAVLWGGDVVAGEEERGTIDVLLANPVSRRRVVMEKWAAMMLGVVVVMAGLGAALGVGAQIVGLHVGWDALTSVVLATTLLAALYATVALALGAATGRRGLARGVSTLLAVAAYLVSSLAEIVRWLRPVRPLSPWYHALGVDPLASGFLPVHLLVLAGITVVLVAGAVVAYERRDLAV